MVVLHIKGMGTGELQSKGAKSGICYSYPLLLQLVLAVSCFNIKNLSNFNLHQYFLFKDLICLWCQIWVSDFQGWYDKANFICKPDEPCTTVSVSYIKRVIEKKNVFYRYFPHMYIFPLNWLWQDSNNLLHQSLHKRYR